MKIAFVSLMRVFPWGGSEELWFQAARLALSQGHQVTTLTQRWNPVPEKIRELRELGATIEFYERAEYSLAQRVAIKMKLVKPLLEIVPAVEADVVVLSNGTTWDFIYHRPITDRVLHSRQPYLMISQHSYENGHLVPEADRDYAIERLRGACKLLFVSERNRLAAERQLAYAIAGAQVVDNPLAIQEVGIKPYPASDKLLMACVARLDCEYKGQDLLLQALGTSSWRARDFQLRFYGAGPHAAHLRHLIAHYGLDEKVSLEGHVKNIDAIWDDNQVLVLPSLSEGTPLALVETMLSGRAALATNVGDISRYVRDGDTGLLVDTASVEGLSDGLERLWHQRAELAEMGDRAFDHAKQITDFQPATTLLGLIEAVVPLVQKKDD